MTEKSCNEKNTVKNTNWAVRCFEGWPAKKKKVIDFKSATMDELNILLQQFNGNERNWKRGQYLNGFPPILRRIRKDRTNAQRGKCS